MRSYLDGESLLALWERALSQPAAARGDSLVEGSCRSLGERNARLAALHRDLFGPEIELLSRCPECGEQVQFGADADAIAGSAPSAESTATQRIAFEGHSVEFRLPLAADVAAAAVGQDDDESFARRLLERCLLSSFRDGDAVTAAELPPGALDAVSRRMEDLDPAASVSFAVECPRCAHRWEARLDLPDLVWRKLRGAAERLLLDIDTLARAYGWTERDVLALGPTRRAAYVQMAAS